MRFTKIGENKLRVYLTGEDVIKHKLCGVDADTDLSRYKRTLFHIIDLAERQVGFAPRGDKLLLQYYTSEDGGGELFVTRLKILSEPKQALISKAKGFCTLERNMHSYIFRDSKSLIDFVKALSTPNRELVSSSLFFTEDGCYMLSVESVLASKETEEYIEIGEFSSSVSEERYLYLREHSALLLDGNALQRLTVLLPFISNPKGSIC